MSGGVFVALMLAAVLHAGWNALVKGAEDKALSTLGVAAGAAVLAALALPFAPPMAPEALPFLPVSAALQVLYYALVARTYQNAEMSLAYPLMRGTAPLLVALLGLLFFGEALPPFGWAGVAVVSLAILAMAAAGGGGTRKGIAFAFATAGIICIYTLVDGAGARASGAALSYTLWIFLLTGVVFTLIATARQGPGLIPALIRQWRPALAGGAGTLLSYGIALWAMTQAPVGMVAALRETSILFAVVISALFLGERPGRARWIAAGGIATGALLLRLA